MAPKARRRAGPEAAAPTPTEVRTLAGVMDELARRGFTEHFMLVDGQLRGINSGQAVSASELRIVEHHRFEGVSDPDDMSILYAIETRSGLRGTLTDAFGVYADPLVGAFIRGLRKAAPRPRPR
jgi:hypothetical protein